jgi:hypothetical protein
MRKALQVVRDPLHGHIGAHALVRRAVPVVKHLQSQRLVACHQLLERVLQPCHVQLAFDARGLHQVV